MTYQVLLDVQGSRNPQMMELHTAGPPNVKWIFNEQILHNIVYTYMSMYMYMHLSSGNIQSPVYMQMQLGIIMVLYTVCMHHRAVYILRKLWVCEYKLTVPLHSTIPLCPTQ